MTSHIGAPSQNDLHGGMSIYNQNDILQQQYQYQQQLYQQQLFEQQLLLQQQQQQQQQQPQGGTGNGMIMGGGPIGVYPGMPMTMPIASMAMPMDPAPRLFRVAAQIKP